MVVAYLYGSHAQGHATDRSDVDVGVLLDDWPGPGAGLDRTLDLNRLVASALGLAGERVDVKTLNGAPLRLLHQVVAKGRPVYVRDEAERVRFEADVMDRYFDFLPVIRLQAKARRERFRDRTG